MNLIMLVDSLAFESHQAACVILVQHLNSINLMIRTVLSVYRIVVEPVVLTMTWTRLVLASLNQSAVSEV